MEPSQGLNVKVFPEMLLFIYRTLIWNLASLDDISKYTTHYHGCQGARVLDAKTRHCTLVSLCDVFELLCLRAVHMWGTISHATCCLVNIQAFLS